MAASTQPHSPGTLEYRWRPCWAPCARLAPHSACAAPVGTPYSAMGSGTLHGLPVQRLPRMAGLIACLSDGDPDRAWSLMLPAAGRMHATGRQASLIWRAQVSLPIVRQFVASVERDALGVAVLKGVRPDQQLVKVVNDQLIALMGGQQEDLVDPKDGPQVGAACLGSRRTWSTPRMAPRWVLLV